MNTLCFWLLVFVCSLVWLYTAARLITRAITRSIHRKGSAEYGEESD